MNKPLKKSTAGQDADSLELDILKRAYEREKTRRKHAESMLESKSRDFYLANENLINTNTALQNANNLLENQTTIISGLSDSYNKVRQDLGIAARTQLELLPSPVDLPALCADGIFKPADYIAGDGYDYFLLDDDLFAFYMIDVAGHGIAAALVSFAVQIHLNPKVQGICQQSINETDSLRDAVSNTLCTLNKSFYLDNATSPYFTMIYGIIELSSGLVTFGQAGHPPPMLYSRRHDSIAEYGDGGNPVAMFSEPVFGISECQMDPGDRLILYSDGATECSSMHGVEFGSQRLADRISQSATLELFQASTFIAEQLHIWNDSDVFEDDLSILQIEYKGCTR